MRCRLASAVLLLAPAFVSNALAQSYDDPTLGQSPVIEHPQDYKPLGIRLGTIMVHPGIELAAEFHDNILYTSDNTISDEIWHVRPYVTAQSTWSRHSISARLAADIARYEDNDFRDYEDYFLQIGGHVDVSLQSKFSYGLDGMELHEDRNVRSAEQGIGPTTYSLTGGNLGYDHTFNRLTVGLSYIQSSLDYDNNRRLDGTVIDNSDRDRTAQSYALRLGYQMTSDSQVFAQLGRTDTEYDQKFDRNGFDRSSDTSFFNAGLDWQITGVLKGDFYASYSEREYDDPNLVDTEGWGPGAGLTWTPTGLTTVRATISTSVEDTTQASASGYVRNLYSVRVDHELLRNLQLNAQYSYYKNDYELLPGAPEFARDEDTESRWGVGATYFVNRSVWISASYDFSDFSSNVPNDDFESGVAWLVLGLER